ncbi:MAG TPA: hypothetical protein VLF15_00290 [Pseudoxanthomonas sp.]|nr:hypothetical protein [Pseudoxanthomonas sp.]
MTSESRQAWWRQLGNISQGMLFLDGHIATPQAASLLQATEASPAAAVPDGPVQQQESQQRRQDGYAKRIREMTALSLFR